MMALQWPVQLEFLGTPREGAAPGALGWWPGQAPCPFCARLTTARSRPGPHCGPFASTMSLHGKRKEIYKYEAPWTVYAMNWSVRPDKRFRLALGSFVEEYNNMVYLTG